MRPSLRILPDLILAFLLAWLATSLMGSGGPAAFASQSEAALALAGRFETTSWLSLASLQVIAAASYLLGLSAVSLRDYMLGTLAALPALLGYVSLGAFARVGFGVDGAARSFQWALLAAGFAATALAIAHVGALVAKVPDGARAPPT